MTKAEFLDRLCQGLRFHSDPDEIQKTVNFYSEAIDDRMEDGQTEEEAVAAMGNIDDIIWNVRTSWSRESRESSGGRVEAGDVRRTWDAGAVSRIDVYDTSGEVEILPSADGRIGIEYTASEDWRYDITGEGGLTVRRVRNSPEERVNFDLFGRRFSITKPDFGGMFSKDLRLKISLPECSSVYVNVNSASGGVMVQNVSMSGLSVKLASGDTELENVILAGKLSLITASGDVALTRVDTPEAGVSTVSGDIELRDVRSASVGIRTVSGDLNVSDLAATENVNLGSVSGDICAAFSVPFKKLSADTVSGDTHLALPGDSELYTIAAESRTGDVDIHGRGGSGGSLVRVKSLSGDIAVSFGK